MQNITDKSAILSFIISKYLKNAFVRLIFKKNKYFCLIPQLARIFAHEYLFYENLSRVQNNHHCYPISTQPLSCALWCISFADDP